MRQLLSPICLMLGSWAFVILGAIWTFGNLDELDLVRTFMAREQLELSAVTYAGILWLALGLAVYCLGDAAIRLSLRPNCPFHAGLCPDTAAKITFNMNICFVMVTLVWITTSAIQVGGFRQLAASVLVDSLGTRDLLLENKLFTGMRLFYAALPATGCFAAALLMNGGLSARKRRLCQITLVLNAVLLFVLPIVMSQRLLLLQFILSAYLAACLVNGRPFGLIYICTGLLLFFGLWLAREAITNPSLDHSTAQIAGQKLAFYLVNDMWNSLAPLSRPIPHTNGALTFEGLTFLTLTDGLFSNSDPSQIPELNAVIGGGEFPFFASAYVDFGPILGALTIAALAALFRLVFHRACETIGWAVIYGQLGAALLFSSHSVYVTHQNFLFSLVVIAIIARLSRRFSIQNTVLQSNKPSVLVQ